MYQKTRIYEKMLINPRCFSCGKPIGHLYAEFLKRVEAGEKPKRVLDELGLERYCCRALFLGHVDLLPLISKFKKF